MLRSTERVRLWCHEHSDVGIAVAAASGIRDMQVDQACPGVLVIPQNASIAEAIEDLLLIWVASDAADWENLIASLPL